MADTLTGLQQAFVYEFLKDFNGTRAARAAGYKGDDNVLAVQAHRLRENPKVAAEIQRLLSERCMGADEVLLRLAQQARGSVGDFWEIAPDGSVTLSLGTEQAKEKLHLIKKLKVKRTERPVGDGEIVTTTETEFELYDAQAALRLIGQHHALFVDRTELTGKGGAPLKAYVNFSPDDWDNDATG